MTALATVASDRSIEDKILEYIAGQLPGASNVQLEAVERIAVGWSHETWLFDAHWIQDGYERSRGFCLRRDPGNTLLRHMSDLKQQFRVLQCLDPTPLPTPTPYWYEEDEDLLGSPFLVMEKVKGVCPSPWGKPGREYYAQAFDRGILPHSFTETLACLHTLDWESAGLSFLGAPATGTSFALTELTKWRELIELTRHDPEPVLIDLIQWLEDNAPTSDRVVLVHGAYRTGNLLVQNDRISAVLDWELQVLGDPMFDVAYVLSDLTREGTDRLSNIVDRSAFYREYEAATGIEIDDRACRYYQMLYIMRSAAFWMSANDLYASGRSNDLRLSRTAWSLPGVLDRAARELGY
jgi:aminoglycoside phosphotransferase (APT) family kinase protein